MTFFFLPALILYLTAGAIPLIISGQRSWLVSSLMQAGAAVLTILGSGAYLLGFAGHEQISFFMTPMFPVVLGADRLTACFTLLLGLLTIATSMYTPGYLSRCHGERSRDLICGLIPLFLAAMMLVLLAQTIFAFLLFWEVMAVLSFILVLGEYTCEKTRYAAFFYLVMTQISTVCLMSGIIILYLQTGSFQFPAGLSLASPLGLAAFISLFLGAAIKAGVIPFHKWLPYAHPAAASPVSALMSGMMLNVALYLVFRMVTDIFLPDLSAGLGILLAGCVTAVLGVMYALKEDDIKGLLAYSSIDNTGVVLIGIGLFVVMTATGLPDIGTMAFLGALIHAISHGTFKGLLFLAAGSVYQATGTKKIDELGGLLVRMPWTGGLFFIGMLAISAIPPLNGFAGELLIYQSLILGLSESLPVIQVLLIIALSLFGLCSALTAVCFVKAFGLTFLALPRSRGAEKAREVPISMRVGPAVLAAACILGGVFSSQILAILGYPGYMPDLFGLSVLLLFTGVIIYGAVYACASRETRIDITWSCGMNAPTGRMEYTGSGFTQPVVRIFSPVYRTRFYVSKEYADDDHCFIRGGKAHLSLMKFFEEYLYLPVARLTDRCAALIASLQNGRADTYVLYVFITVVMLLIGIGWFA